MSTGSSSNRAGTRWAVRIIPFFILGALGFATYVVVPHLCINYLHKQKKKTSTAIALIVLHILFLVLSLLTYLRTFITIQLNPGFVPLSAEREALEKERKKNKRRTGRGRDIEAQPWIPPDSNPDSPGLEAFYSKDVFVCELDGRPKWCSDCRTWKPDRAHHSSELDRCIRKMDHLCPWVGGVISETSFNFFVQFTFYTCIYCAICLGTGAYSLKLQNQENRSLDGRIVALLALAGLFGFFTFAMTATSLRFVFTNITNIDMLKKTQTYRLAVRVPSNTISNEQFQTVTYPLSNPNFGPNGEQLGEGAGPDSASSLNVLSPRDQQAKRTFAILTMDPEQNPWDQGYWKNWKTVMGNNVFEWFLPIRYSPCCNHDSMVSDYEFGPLLDEMKQKYGIPDTETPTKGGIEMRNSPTSRQ